MKFVILLFLPICLYAPPHKLKHKNPISYEEHIRLKLNKILEIPEGRNYWEKEFKTQPYEDKLKNYFKNLK